MWDFDDLDASEARLRARLEDETSDPGRAEVLTQLARVHGLRGEFGKGDHLVDEAAALAGSSPAAQVRVSLERGRLRRSSGDPEAALALFEEAFAVAVEGSEDWLAADAAHMAALAAPDRDGMLAWTRRGIELASESADARYWLGPLLNNLGWEHYEAGEHEQALEAFERALRAREEDPDRSAEIEIARYAVAKALRALGRPQEAAVLLEQSVAWTQTVGEPDGWFHEELAECYAALGRDADAREQAQAALPLVSEADTDRVARLRALSGAS
jgi:tetratricopeptide (TPR) repeat protein